MLEFILIGAGLVAITVAIHAVGTTAWVKYLAQHYLDDDRIWGTKRVHSILILTVILMVFLHTLQITIWAFTYILLAPEGELASLEKALYFSFVTFTTLGYGDITLSEGWRLLSGIQALNGILLVGWTTALIFAVVQKTWQGLGRKSRK